MVSVGFAVVINPVPQWQARSTSVPTSPRSTARQNAAVVSRSNQLQQGSRTEAVGHSWLEHAL